MATGLGDEQLWLSATNDNTGTSTAFDDQSGNGNDGTPGGGMLVVADASDGGTYCFNFNGVNQHISCSTLGAGNKDAFAVSCWVQADVDQTSYLFSMQGTSGSADNSVDGYMTTSPNQIACWVRPNAGITYQSQSITGAWYHIAFSRDAGSGTIKYYVNGVNTVSSNNSDLASFANGMNWGVYGDGSTSRFDGKMDDMRVYDRVLTQAEITHLASARGVEGPAPVGLGDEKLWWVPTLANSTIVDISSDEIKIVERGTPPTLVADTDSGGQYAGQFTTSGALEVADFFEFISTGDHAVCGWIKSDSNRITIGGQQVGGFAANKFGTILEDMGTVYTANTRAWVFDGTDSAIINAGSSAADNTWHHLCFTRIGATCTLYVDGVQSAQDTYPNYTTYTPDKTLILGGFWNGNSYAYTSTGYMDDIRIYERGISQAEITHLASSRGVEGPAPVGLGDEKLWWVPTHSVDLFLDSSSSGHSVTNTGTAPTFVADTDAGGQYAGQFSTSGSIRVQDQFGFLSTGDFSMSGWIKSATSARMVFGGQQAGSLDNDKSGGMIDQNSGVSRARFRSGGTDSNDLLTTASAVPNNTWHHVTATREGSDCKVYVNGVLAGTKTISGYPSSPDLKDLLIGGLWNSTNPLSLSTGYMDDIRIYDRSLTQAEVTHLATSRGIEGGPGTPPTTGFYNPFINKIFNNDYTRRIR